MTAVTSPLVSVVTPFYNTAEYLAECIESVLAQSLRDFEYVLVNNCSTDGSDLIAKRYAAQDSRIRLVDNTAFLSQVDNYNHALRCISPNSKYCKIVQADDWIFPSCLQEMVLAAEAFPNIALVGSYSLFDPLPIYGPRPYVGHAGLPYSVRLLPGREVLRRYLSEFLCLFGSPTCVMFRCSDVRAASHFFRADSPVEDVEACFDVLKRGDFAFVHQVLTFNRRDPQSLWWRMSAWNADAVNKLIILRRHGKDIFSEAEYAELLGRLRRGYYSYLADVALEGRDSEFWKFHRDCLAAAELPFERRYLALHILRALLGLIACPRALAGKLVRRLSRTRA
jgi:glycosyltransferase involved in cell wall biosynthesis